MKKTILLISLFTAFISHSQIKKAAIISIYGSKNLSDDPLETKLYEALLDDDSFDISKTVLTFEEMIETKIVPSFGFPFMPKSDVVTTEEYKGIKTRYMEEIDEKSSGWDKFFQGLVPAEGYKNLASFGIVNDKKAILKFFELFPDVDAVMIAYIDYNLYDGVGAFGMSKKKVYANANIKLFNRDGKRIFKLKESESSDKGVLAVVGIVPSPEKLKPLIEEATENLFNGLDKKIAKSMKKMLKKLNK